MQIEQAYRRTSKRQARGNSSWEDFIYVFQWAALILDRNIKARG